MAWAIVGSILLLTGTVYYVGRQIARVLWGILCSIENDAEQREIYERQSAQLFGDTVPSVKTRIARERGQSSPR